MEYWVTLTRKPWLKGKRAVAFVGDFSAGKTSIVNRILSQDNPNAPLLPVSTEATTAIPTYIVGSHAATTYQFVSPDDRLKEISEETFRRVNKRVLAEVKGVSSLIKNFVMSCKTPNLQGLSILDTPGFSSNDKEDSKRTLEVINECNALFWVFDVNNGTVNRNSLKLIKEKLQKPLYVVINKVDTKAKSEVDKVEALVRRTMEEAGIEIEDVIRFSKKEPVQNILNLISNVEAMDYTDFPSYLKDNITRYIQELSPDQDESQDAGSAVDDAALILSNLNWMIDCKKYYD